MFLPQIFFVIYAMTIYKFTGPSSKPYFLPTAIFSPKILELYHLLS